MAVTQPFKVPVVQEDLCLGCGMCEMQCPVFDRGAIEVYRFGENRRASGPYAGGSQKRKIDALREKSGQSALMGPDSFSGGPHSRNDTAQGKQRGFSE